MREILDELVNVAKAVNFLVFLEKIRFELSLELKVEGGEELLVTTFSYACVSAASLVITPPQAKGRTKKPKIKE